MEPLEEPVEVVAMEEPGAREETEASAMLGLVTGLAGMRVVVEEVGMEALPAGVVAVAAAVPSICQPRLSHSAHHW